ncbi:MAG: hypothetical protein JW750_05975 [Anaerolineaceae bacterium]|nr:hypothetical protein [Anaerolineaceae bacterium]
MLGILSIFQMICLPGALAARLLRLKGSWMQRVVAVTGLSLFSNYLLVLLLHFTGLYMRWMLIAVLMVEIGGLIYLTIKDRRAFSDWADSFWNGAQRLLNRAAEWLKNIQSEQRFVELIFAIVSGVIAVVALARVFWFAKFIPYNLGSVFSTWDAVVSWNRWAVEWTNGVLPTSVAYYPQLLPTNWSISYVLMGNDQVQFFAKAIMPLFSLLIALMLVDLSIKKRALQGMIGVIALTFLIKEFQTTSQIVAGYADLPLAAMAFAVVYQVLMVSDEADVGQVKRYSLVAFLLACGAAVTKQPGLYVMGLSPFLIYFVLFYKHASLREATFLKRAALIVVIFGLLTLFWYGLKVIGIEQGKDASNLGFLLKERYEDANILRRMIDALFGLGIYGAAFAVLFAFLLYSDRLVWWITLLIPIPYVFFWGAFANYSTRNLALAIPFWALALGTIADGAMNWGKRILATVRLERLPVIVLGLIAALLLAVGGLLLPDEQLERANQQQRQEIFSPSMNQYLLELANSSDEELTIFTNYPVEHIPGIKMNKLTMNLQDDEAFMAMMDSGRADLLLLHPASSEPIRAWVEDRINEGTFTVLFIEADFLGYRLIFLNP